VPGFWEAFPADRLLAEFSLWSADLLRLRDEIARAEPFADLFHIDVSDGHFTPRLLFFPDLTARVREATARPLHVHVMANRAVLEAQIDHFADAGADLISVHDPKALDSIHERGKAAGLVLTPDVPTESVEPHLRRVDMITLLGTAPGVKGEGLLPEALPRLRRMRAMLDAGGLGGRVRIGADGGIRRDTVPQLRAAGADTVVMGSLAFGSDDLPATIGWLRSL
jgi:ribulose-phosphate 3-epimerase